MPTIPEITNDDTRKIVVSFTIMFLKRYAVGAVPIAEKSKETNRKRERFTSSVWWKKFAISGAQKKSTKYEHQLTIVLNQNTEL